MTRESDENWRDDADNEQEDAGQSGPTQTKHAEHGTEDKYGDRPHRTMDVFEVLQPLPGNHEPDVDRDDESCRADENRCALLWPGPRRSCKAEQGEQSQHGETDSVPASGVGEGLSDDERAD